MPQDPDTLWLEDALADIGEKSARLPWHRDAGTRWDPADRVDVEWSDELGAVPRVDLHGLDQRLTREVVTRVLAGRAELRAPAVRFVTGSGTHSEDGVGVLGGVVEGCVAAVAGVSMHPTGDLPWRDVLIGGEVEEEEAERVPVRRRRRVAREPEAQPGVLGRVFQGIMTALVAALVGAVAATFRAVLGAPGRAIARLFGGKKRRVRKKRRR